MTTYWVVVACLVLASLVCAWIGLSIGARDYDAFWRFGAGWLFAAAALFTLALLMTLGLLVWLLLLAEPL